MNDKYIILTTTIGFLTGALKNILFQPVLGKRRLILFIPTAKLMKRNIHVHQKAAVPAVLAIALISFSFTAFHHGWSSYDQKKVLNLKGEILEYSYDNPHGMLKFKTEDKTWTVVLAPPSRMESRGLPESMFKVGGQATVVGYPHLKIKDEMRAERIIIGDKTTELR